MDTAVQTVAPPFSSPWTRALALLLLAALGLQAAPVQPLVQHLLHESPHQQCSHPQGVCPMNPDGPCQCNHDAPSSPDEPTLRSCGTSGPVAVLTVALPKWLPSTATPIPAPRSDRQARTPHRLVLVSQRRGDDVFHPPQSQADRRPARTRPARPSA